VLCCAVLCCAVLCCAVLCCAVRRAVPCRAVLRCAALGCLRRLFLPPAGEYTAQFEALLLEEAREAVRGGWAEAAQAGHLFDASVIGCAAVRSRPWSAYLMPCWPSQAKVLHPHLMLVVHCVSDARYSCRWCYQHAQDVGFAFYASSIYGSA